MIKKAKLIKKPKFDLTKLMELYQERPEQMSKGEKKGAVAGEEGEADKEEPKNLLAAKK